MTVTASATRDRSRSPTSAKRGRRGIGAGSALIVGLGGLGCPAAQFLATSGIGKLVLNDFDRVDETNLPRQILYTADDVGKLKVDAAAARLRALNPNVARRRRCPSGSTAPRSTRRSRR